jgi:hypothetical protein
MSDPLCNSDDVGCKRAHLLAVGLQQLRSHKEQLGRRVAAQPARTVTRTCQPVGAYCGETEMTENDRQSECLTSTADVHANTLRLPFNQIAHAEV